MSSLRGGGRPTRGRWPRSDLAAVTEGRQPGSGILGFLDASSSEDETILERERPPASDLGDDPGPSGADSAVGVRSGAAHPLSLEGEIDDSSQQSGCMNMAAEGRHVNCTELHGKLTAPPCALQKPAEQRIQNATPRSWPEEGVHSESMNSDGGQLRCPDIGSPEKCRVFCDYDFIGNRGPRPSRD